MSGPWANQIVLFSLESRCFPRLRLGKHQDSQENQLFPSGSDIKCIIVRDSEPIRLLESPRSLSVYLTIIPQSRMGSEAMAYEAEGPMSN